MNIKKLFYRVIFVSLVIQSISFAQYQDTVLVLADSLKENNISLNMPWRYKPGDDTLLAELNYDDSGWDTLNPRMLFRDIGDSNWTGLGWFRKYIKIDSSLVNSNLGLRIEHVGASEIYLNGDSVMFNGKVSDSLTAEEIFQRNSVPIVLPLDSNQVYVLAVKYSNQHINENPKWYEKWIPQAGFTASLTMLNEGIYSKVQNEKITNSVNFGLMGIFLSLAMLYFFLFLFYQRRKENLFYSLFTFFIAVLFAAGMISRFIISNIDLLVVVRASTAIAVSFIFLAYIGFLYSIFYKKIPRQFWIFLTYTLISSSFIFLYIDEDILNYALFGFIFVATLEGLRIIIVALKNKKSNSWIIGLGVIAFVIFILFMFVLGIIGENINSIWGILLFFVGIFALPVSMSIYLARDIAQTNKNLETQLIKVKDLSEQRIEQERKNAELKIEKELAEGENLRKTKELEEARALQLSMLPKSLPELPNLDIAVYMQTATEVGGDYYDFHVSLDGTLTVVLGDATGHGMKAGTMVTATKSLFNALAENQNILLTFHEMTRCLKLLNFTQLSMCFSMMKIFKNKMILSSAGIPPVMIFRSEKNIIEELVIKGMPLGTIDDFPYVVKETELNPGDTILMMSDGFPELMNHEKEMYGYTRIKSLFGESGTKDPEKIISKFRSEGEKWLNGKEAADDITFVVIKVK